MLIAEDLLLLLTDDRTGKLLAPSTPVDIALGGAVMIELPSWSPAARNPIVGGTSARPLAADTRGR